jgi:hypothetical protein
MSLAKTLVDSAKLAEPLADMVKSGGVVISDHIWQNPIKFGILGVGANQPCQFLEIHMLGILMHFPATTWQPMTGPHGDLSLAHVTTSCIVTSMSSCSIILPCHMTGGCTVCKVTVQNATWHLFIGP